MSEAEAEAKPAAATGKGKNPGTEYLVLMQDESKTWEEVAAMTARSPRAAIKSHMETQGLEEGTFAAVPARSWVVETPKAKTQTRIVFE